MSDRVSEPVEQPIAQEAPEDAMAAMRAQLEAREAELAAARAAAADAEARAATAGNVAANSQEAQLGALITSEESKLQNARVALRTARADGDMEKEEQAIEAMASAKQRVDLLKSEQTRLQSRRGQPQPADGGKQPQQQGRIPGPAARLWMDDHPKINHDPAYQKAAEMAHNRAIARGFVPESPEYFQSINTELEQRFGADHGRDQNMPPPRQTQQPARRAPPASSFAAPRGGGGNGAGGRTSPVEIARLMGGDVTADDIREFAVVNKLSVEEYCTKMAKVLEERGAAYDNGGVYR
jgi:hypothetical protein